ncbi:unnamed protein product [Symbiodinium necroappetens]|uniref:Uncharacterized protein n=1 Tax=Symbiodinium necroappetens TaxID=1628268 RepID=A0A812P4S7_9DINO|nr:unnamed protein product [Symbiodinium necroappetens]
MFERWCRSVGVDLFDLLLASIRHPWYSLLSKYGATLLYCSLHEQALVLHTFCTAKYRDARRISGSLPESNCASWANGALQNEVTNNFAEIKSTVFKRYEEKSLFPIIASDIVERFYVMLDIIFVIARLLLLLVVLEIGTDWIKFCLITKFSEMQAKTFEVYWEVLLADILLCRCGNLRNSQVVGSGEDLLLKDESDTGLEETGIFLVGFAARRRSRIPRGRGWLILLLRAALLHEHRCVALLHRCLCLSSSYRLVASSDLLAFGPYLGFDIVTSPVQLASTREASLFFCHHGLHVCVDTKCPSLFTLAALPSRADSAGTAEPAEADRMAAAVMCPGTVWSEMRSIPRQERQFLLQLQALLKQLDPSARRRVITERLTQAQRLALERYMLTAQKCRATRLACNARKKVLKASNRGRARKLRFARRAFNEDNPRDAAGESSHPQLPPNGRKACVHLGRGFYAHCKLDASAQEISFGSLDVADADADAGAGGVHRVSGLKLTLESRVATLGPGGQIALQLLLGQLALKSGKVQRHEALDVCRLGEDLLAEEASKEPSEYFLAAAKELNERRPQVVVLELDGCPSWEKASTQLLEALRGFHGAVVIATEEETDLVKSICPICWRDSAGWLWQAFVG